MPVTAVSEGERTRKRDVAAPAPPSRSPPGFRGTLARGRRWLQIGPPGTGFRELDSGNWSGRNKPGGNARESCDWQKRSPCPGRPLRFSAAAGGPGAAAIAAAGLIERSPLLPAARSGGVTPTVPPRCTEPAPEVMRRRPIAGQRLPALRALERCAQDFGVLESAPSSHLHPGPRPVLCHAEGESDLGAVLPWSRTIRLHNLGCAPGPRHGRGPRISRPPGLPGRGGPATSMLGLDPDPSLPCAPRRGRARPAPNPAETAATPPEPQREPGAAAIAAAGLIERSPLLPASRSGGVTPAVPPRCTEPAPEVMRRRPIAGQRLPALRALERCAQDFGVLESAPSSHLHPGPRTRKRDVAAPAPPSRSPPGFRGNVRPREALASDRAPGNWIPGTGFRELSRSGGPGAAAIAAAGLIERSPLLPASRSGGVTPTVPPRCTERAPEVMRRRPIAGQRLPALRALERCAQDFGVLESAPSSHLHPGPRPVLGHAEEPQREPGAAAIAAAGLIERSPLLPASRSGGVTPAVPPRCTEPAPEVMRRRPIAGQRLPALRALERCAQDFGVLESAPSSHLHPGPRPVVCHAEGVGRSSRMPGRPSPVTHRPPPSPERKPHGTWPLGRSPTWARSCPGPGPSASPILAARQDPGTGEARESLGHRGSQAAAALPRPCSALTQTHPSPALPAVAEPRPPQPPPRRRPHHRATFRPETPTSARRPPPLGLGPSELRKDRARSGERTRNRDVAAPAPPSRSPPGFRGNVRPREALASDRAPGNWIPGTGFRELRDDSAKPRAGAVMEVPSESPQPYSRGPPPALGMQPETSASVDDSL
ncbi:nascent polypeptide-associated complex subunit alpha, muscle-specific form-like, partial [Pteropus medius]|uniref:nascent polypeptide-associated complex subunit alpha, muscle-specific form-like n=1 Tax=Pteropus vampyrus TaxID=132908 RepID=UPI00196ADF0F